jgi:hypothetical protein
MTDPATDGNGEAGSSWPRGFRLLGDVVAESDERIEWLVPDIIAAGLLTILSGDPKVGKSTFVAGMLDALAIGGDFLGNTLPQTQAVWLTEERPPTLRPKVADWPGIKDVALLMTHQRDGRDWPELIADATHLALTTGRRLLVVDTFASWAQLAGDDEQSSGRVMDAMTPLLLAAGQGLAVLLIHHDRKSGGDHGRAIRGSNALSGAADILAQLTRSTAEHPSRRRLSTNGRLPEVVLHITLGPDGYHLADAETGSKDNGDDALLLRHLDTDGRTVGDMQERAGLSDKRTRASLARLYEAGLAACETAPGRGGGYLYSLADASLSTRNPISGEGREASDAAPCGITGHTTWTTPEGLTRCKQCQPPAISTAEQLAL